MTEAVIIQIQPKPRQFNKLAALIGKMVEQVRTQPGCLQAEILLAPDREEIAVLQRWKDNDALSEYLVWRSQQEELEIVYDLIEEEPDFKCFTLCQSE